MTAETYGLLPHTHHHPARSSEGGIAAITAVYHSAEGAPSPQRSSLRAPSSAPPSTRTPWYLRRGRGSRRRLRIESARRDLEGNVRWDTEEMMHVIRALPLKERFRASFDVFDPANAAQYSVVVQVTSVETMSTPSGEFRCWRVDVEGLGMRVWVAVEHPYQLVSFELVTGEPWACSPTTSSAEARIHDLASGLGIRRVRPLRRLGPVSCELRGIELLSHPSGRAPHPDGAGSPPRGLFYASLTTAASAGRAIRIRPRVRGGRRCW